MAQTANENGNGLSRPERSGGLQDAGSRYRFARLTLPIVLRDPYFNNDDPGPGDRVPEFDLPIVGGAASVPASSPGAAPRC